MNHPPTESLTFFFPMWNEESMMDQTLAAAHEAGLRVVADGLVSDYEILIVDDASTDRTGEMADAYAAADPRVRVVHHAVNRKLGGAIRTGFEHAHGDLILYSDADLPFDLLEAGKAIRLLRTHHGDIISAYRLDRTSEGVVRAVYSFVYNHLIRWGLGLRVRDVNFAFKLVHRRVLDAVDLRSDGSFIDAELLGKASRLGFHVLQFGVDYFPRTRGVSTLSSPRVILMMLTELRAMARDIRRMKPLLDAEADDR